MRKEIILNGGWRFHKGDIAEPVSQDKGFIYSQSKTERKLSGPAAYNYRHSGFIRRQNDKSRKMGMGRSSA